MVPPLPIPNREVKHSRADGTAHPWESRSPPFSREPWARDCLRLFFLFRPSRADGPACHHPLAWEIRLPPFTWELWVHYELGAFFVYSIGVWVVRPFHGNVLNNWKNDEGSTIVRFLLYQQVIILFEFGDISIIITIFAYQNHPCKQGCLHFPFKNDGLSFWIL